MRTASLLGALLLSTLAHGADIQSAKDQVPPALDIRTGHEIPSEGYCDQPYVVVLSDGTWLCTCLLYTSDAADE